LNSTFEGLPEEKKKRIIDAALEEFAANGYDKASTNSIVKKAEISKGILFHYFGSKKNLFLYIFDYAINYLMNKYYAEMDDWPSDPFERLIWISSLKVKIYYDAPLMYKLAFNAIMNMPKELERDLHTIYNRFYSKLMPEIFRGTDTSKFKEGIDAQKAIELIMLCIDGLSNKYLRIYKDKPVDEIFNNVEPIMEEFNEYIEILKYGIYKEDCK
jgi:TetR/AcrR family transcriptional regulator